MKHLLVSLVLFSTQQANCSLHTSCPPPTTDEDRSQEIFELTNHTLASLTQQLKRIDLSDDEREGLASQACSIKVLHYRAQEGPLNETDFTTADGAIARVNDSIVSLGGAITPPNSIESGRSSAGYSTDTESANEQFDHRSCSPDR